LATAALPRSASASSVPIASEPLVDLGFDPGHEEAGHRGDPGQLLAVGRGLLQPVEVGAHDRAVALHGEDQRDVHAHALAERAGDRRQPGLGGRDLDQQVGPVDGLPQVQRLGEGALGVAGQARLDLQRDPPVDAAAGLPGAAEHVAGLLDVGHGDLADGVVDRGAAGGELADLLVVGGPVRERRGEDGRVGGDPDDVLLADQLLQVAAAQPLARQVVEPDGHAGRGEGGQTVVGHGGSPLRRACSGCAGGATTFSVVKPNSRNSVW
jgi:hypothetical protein